MKHYVANVHCNGCGHRFSVCVHSRRVAANSEGLTVHCPKNHSRVHVAAGTLTPVDSCPVGAVVVRDNLIADSFWRVKRWLS
jgi:hypothetical protein